MHSVNKGSAEIKTSYRPPLLMSLRVSSYTISKASFHGVIVLLEGFTKIFEELK